ncbi:hypothetical protein N7540_006777 [Penicillium herquei]|nr:hypothetical protein N7540_006777 [Penicillium herquei]
MAAVPAQPAQGNEYQFWTDPVLCEETRARLEHFRSLGWLPPNFKPKTLQGIAVVERYWRRFCVHVEEGDYVDYLLREEHAIYMNFFDWMFRTSREKVLQSYDEYWRRLCQYYELFAHRRVSEDAHKQIRRYLEGRFPAERKIPRRTKDKNTLDVDVFCVLYRHHWVHSRFFSHGSLIVQFATVQLWSAITGTRPGVLVPQGTTLPDHSTLGNRKRPHAFESDLPNYISLKELPDSVCYRDIELFYLKDPQSKRDVLCAIIEFRNLKGRPEGADGSLPMTYESSRLALKELGRDARFEDDIGHYNYRRWTANEVNKSFTSQERQRVLGQSGDAVFEKHYQSQFIGRDLQHVVLLRPPQDGLVRFAGSMLRKRDLNAPSELTDTHKRAICQHPDILQLRREKRELLAEMISLAGSMKNARTPYPHLYQRHENVKKEIAKLRKKLATDTRETARKDHFQNAPVLEVDRQIKQLLGKSNDVSDEENSCDESWELPIPNYIFPERARLVENFYGSNAENFDEDKLLARRIQVTKDMVALLRLCEPSRRGNRVNWNIDEEDDLLEQPEKSPSPPDDTLKCPTDICIICCGTSRQSASNPAPRKFSPKRQDSLRRHLINMHLAHVHDGISCNWEACRNVPRFADVTKFLAHASTAHSYDINIKLCHLDQVSQIKCNEISSAEASSESENRQRTETPASSVDLEMSNIDPRLLESRPVTIAKSLTVVPDTQISASSVESTMSDSHPISDEVPIRRSTRTRAKLADLTPVTAACQSTREMRSSPEYCKADRQLNRAEPEVERSGNSDVSVKKPLPRRSKRLRSQ